MGNSKNYISENDTVVSSQKSFFMDDTTNVIGKIVDKMTKAQDCDSIKHEISKLNERIRELENQ